LRCCNRRTAATATATTGRERRAGQQNQQKRCQAIRPGRRC
jgi:hypothetical protein